MLTSIAPLVVVVLVLLIVVPLGRRRLAQRLGGADQLVMYRQALRTGEVPPGARIELWRPVLQRLERAVRRQRLFGRLRLAVLVIALAVAVTHLLPHHDRPLPGLLAVLVALVVVVGIFILIERVALRRYRYLARLLESLGPEPPQSRGDR